MLAVVVVLLGCLAVALSLRASFNIDEIEHVHAAWYVWRGATPYVDFFEHHHPLLWYLLAPLFGLVGENSSVMIASRVLLLPLLCAIACSTYALARDVTGSRATARVAVVLLLSSAAFLANALQIRPDVPQVLFAVLAVHLLLGSIKTGSPSRAAAAGLAAGISFVFLQKALLIVGACGIIATRRFLDGSITLRPLLMFAGGFVAACAPGALYLAVSGHAATYFACNWEYNRLIVSRYPTWDAVPTMLPDAAFWGIAIVAGLLFSGGKRTNARLADVAMVFLVSLTLLFVAGRPRGQYFMAVVPFGAVLAASGLAAVSARVRVRQIARLSILAAIMYVPVQELDRRLSEANTGQLARIDFVIEQTRRYDRVYDGANRFNIVRLDMHYLWFTTERVHAVDTINEVTDGRYASYDICSLVRERRPKVISNYLLDLPACGLKQTYRSSPFAGVFVRSDAQLAH